MTNVQLKHLVSFSPCSYLVSQKQDAYFLTWNFNFMPTDEKNAQIDLIKLSQITRGRILRGHKVPLGQDSVRVNHTSHTPSHAHQPGLQAK